MKRIYKKIIIILCLLCFCMSLSGCFYSFENTQDGKFSFGVSKIKKDAFCIGCNWDGGDASFVIPDEFMGYKVTTLGGYTGRGYPCPFSIKVDLNAIYPEYEGTYGQQEDIEGSPSTDEYEVFTFFVHLGVNLINLDYIDGKTYFVRHIEKQNGEIQSDILCKIVYSFTVDSANPRLYAKNGKLYYRENNELVTDFFYE